MLENIDKRQYGFRKLFDTRIAVMNLLHKFKHIKQNSKKPTHIVTIDLAKYFDSVSHKLIRITIKKFIQDKLILNFLLKYYSGNGRDVYQGDPLSQILFAMISHFIISKINNISEHTQMFADDLIMIMKGTKKTNYRKM